MKDQSGNNLFDNDGDNVNGVRNLVGDINNPTGFIYNNGTWQYFRMRLETSPDKNATSYDNFGWGILVDTNGDAVDYELMIMLNGNGGNLFIGQNDEQQQIDDPSDATEEEAFSYTPVRNSTDEAYSRIKPAGTTFGGGTNVFLDFAVPLADMYAANNSSTDTPDNDNRLDAALTASDPLRFFFGTSNQGSSISSNGSDLMADVLSSGFSNPIALDGSTPTITGTIAFKNSGYSADITTYSLGGTIYIQLTSSSMNSSAATVTFTANATDALVQKLVRALSYRSTSDNPSTSDRTITVTATDGSGASSGAKTRTVAVTAANDPPVLALDSGSLAYTENGGATQLSTGATASDAEGDWDTGTLTQITTNGESADELSIPSVTVDGSAIAVSSGNVSVGSTTIGTVSPTSGIQTGTSVLTVTFSANATDALAEVVEVADYGDTGRQFADYLRYVGAGDAIVVSIDRLANALEKQPVDDGGIGALLVQLDTIGRSVNEGAGDREQR